MNLTDAQKLCQLVLDQYGEDSARLVVLSEGREYAVCIKQAGYFCFCFQDWEHFRKEGKRRSADARKERHHTEERFQRAIDSGEVFSLAV